MAEKKTERMTESWNPIRARRISVHGPSASVGWHCEKVSAGCANCSAETMNKRVGTGLDFSPGNRDKVELFLDEKMLLAPLHWRKPRMISVCSMTDLFSDFVPDEWIDRIFAVMALCPQHVFPVSTKWPARMREYFSYEGRASRVWASALKFRGCAEPWPLSNAWIGASCEDQATADARIPDLLATPAAVRFVACEPMIGPINLRRYLRGHEDHGVDLSREAGSKVGCCIGWTPPLDWVICGSESGHGARLCNLEWVRFLKDQCIAAEIHFFWKQHIENKKKITLPELDGRQWAEFPH